MFRRQGKQNKQEIDYLPVIERIREDSRNASRLTLNASLNLVMSEIEDAESSNVVSGILDNNMYPDVKSITGSDDTVYWYSQTYITESQAEGLVQSEELKKKIAEQVRECSKDLAKVTCISALPEAENTDDMELVKTAITDLENDERYSDIKVVAVLSGVLYLYSDEYISNGYATTLIRAEEDDPRSIIASTVRDESRIYPRPTNIDEFSNPVYNISISEFDTYLEDLLEQEEFKDIRLIEASTGARYLYSSLYLNKQYAQSLVEWKEVGEFENP